MVQSSQSAPSERRLRPAGAIRSGPKKSARGLNHLADVSRFSAHIGTRFVKRWEKMRSQYQRVLLMIWNSLAPIGSTSVWWWSTTQKTIPLIISTSFGMKLMPSCSSRQGWRASCRTSRLEPRVQNLESTSTGLHSTKTKPLASTTGFTYCPLTETCAKLVMVVSWSVKPSEESFEPQDDIQMC